MTLNSLAVIDAIGVYGSLLHYSLVIAFVGSAFLIFFYLWKKKLLDMDEEAKFQMMQDNEIGKGEGKHGTKRNR